MRQMNAELPKASIIIPCKTISKYTKECIEKCKKLEYPNLEILVLPDYYDGNADKFGENVHIIPTGKASPGRKRNIGTMQSSGKILAFIDDDAYPRFDWIKNAVKYLNEQKIAAVGGPGITPPEDNEMQKVSGYIYASFLMGNLRKRYKNVKPRESDDIHSCNFVAKRDVIEKVKWNEEYWPGEDTLMCLGIKNLGFKMLEAPSVVVYHHRRPLFRSHLRQVFQFGLHRGFFFKKFPENSRKLIYALPSLLVTVMIAFISSVILALDNWFFSMLSTLIGIVILLYLIVAFIAALEQTRKPKLLFLTWVGIILTHNTYGVGFLKGIIQRDIRKWRVK